MTLSSERKALLPRLTVAMLACSPKSEQVLRKATNCAY
jgi:hypothetical protein